MTAPTLEQLFAGQGFAGVPASGTQRALLRAADGLPTGDDLAPAEMFARFGVEALAPSLPKVVALVKAVRGGGSLMGVCAALRCSMRADLTQAQRHEVPRFAIVSRDMDNASATFRLLTGIVEQSPLLRSRVASEPTAGALFFRRPADGRVVEITSVPASSGGSHLRSRWLVGALLDECALIGGDSGAKVTADELFRAAQPRLLPGGQVWLVSSPFGPTGLLHSVWRQHYGQPGRTLVCWAPSLALNPALDAAEVEALRLSDPDTAAREYDAQWLDADAAFFEASLVDAATRTAPLVRVCKGGAAGMDAGTRGNAWTLAVAVKEGERTVVAGCFQWQGSRSSPLSPKATLASVAGELRPFGISRVYCDGWSFDANRDHAKDVGLSLELYPSGDVPEAYAAVKTALADGSLELPPSPQVRSDLLGVRKRATTGGVRIELMKTSDGRHCDYAPSIALAVAKSARGSSTWERAFAGNHDRYLPALRWGGGAAARPSDFYHHRKN